MASTVITKPNEKKYISNKYKNAKEGINNLVGENHEDSKKNSIVYNFLDEKFTSESVYIKPENTKANKMKYDAGKMLSNKADIKHGELYTDAATRMTGKRAEFSDAKDSFNNTLNAAFQTAYLEDARKEINKRFKEIEQTIAQVDVAIDSFSKGSPIELSENEIIQAKNDVRLISYNINLLMQLADKIALALTVSNKGSTNMQNMIELFMQILDMLEQLIDAIEIASETMTVEDYERVLRLKEIIKENESKKGSRLNTIVKTILDMLQPYITNLSLMLTMECFNAFMEILNKVPGVGDILVPPLDMIPSMIELLGLVMGGDLLALGGRLGKDINILYNYIEASQVVGSVSDAELEEYEKIRRDELVKEGKDDIFNVAGEIADLPTSLEAKQAQVNKFDSDYAEATSAIDEMSNINSIEDTHESDLAELEKEEQANIEGIEAVFTADIIGDKLLSKTIDNKLKAKNITNE